MAAVTGKVASPFIAFPSRRSVVHSSRGVVACTNPLAAQAGLDILRNGGNAAVSWGWALLEVFWNTNMSFHFQDAAVAAAAVLNVVDPSMTGIGGDVFCLFYDAKTKRVRSLNGSGRSPANATLEAVSKALGVAEPQKAIIPRSSIHALTVPGAAAAWVDTVEHFGSGEATLENVLSPSIELAENGFPVSQFSAEMVSFPLVYDSFIDRNIGIHSGL
jgi:gamma-glutamyltranspeptidase / glutathione hydrolase